MIILLHQHTYVKPYLSDYPLLQAYNYNQGSVVDLDSIYTK